MNDLSRIVAEFRSRFHLSKAKAAQVLGVSVVYIRSLEEGRDVRTGLEFEPREGTLRQIASKMADFGYMVSYEDLMVAAGKLSQEQLDFKQGKTPEPTDEQLAKGDLSIPGLKDLAAYSFTSWDDLSAEDKRRVYNVLKAAGQAVIEDIMAGKKQRKLK